MIAFKEKQNSLSEVTKLELSIGTYKEQKSPKQPGKLKRNDHL